MTLATTSHGLALQRVGTLDELASLESNWRELEQSSRELSIFSTWDWCSAVARCLINESSLAILAVWEGRDLVGLAPLASRSWRGIRSLVFLGTGLDNYSRADYQELLLAPGYEERAFAAICSYLKEHERDWDMIWLQEVPHGSTLPAQLEDISPRFGWTILSEQGSDVHIVDDLPESWESFRLRLSANNRKAFERRTRKMLREHGAEPRRVTELEELPAALKALFELHSERWQARGKPGIFHTERAKRFYSEVAAALMRRGRLDLTLLEVGSEVVAARYGFEMNRTTYGYITGFRPGWSAYSVGSLLSAHHIRSAIESGLQRVDFLRGHGEHKQSHGASESFNSEVRVFHSRLTVMRYRVLRVLRAIKIALAQRGGSEKS